MNDSTNRRAPTHLFSHWRAHDQQSTTELLPRLYVELRRIAGSYLSRERTGHTLQPTELVNEAFLRLIGTGVEPSDRNHFFALAARSMRRILVDHARRHQAGKRFAPEARVTLGAEMGSTPREEVDVIALHQALERFAEVAPRPAQLVEMRYFGGLTNPEAAEVLEVSLATVERDWKAARLWLRRQLEG